MYKCAIEDIYTNANKTVFACANKLFSPKSLHNVSIIFKACEAKI